MTNFNSEDIKSFFEAVLLLENEAECDKFFEDICTVKELMDISQRLCVAKALREGKSYQEISSLTGASTTTISRVNKCLLYGSGGYSIILDRMKKEQTK